MTQWLQNFLIGITGSLSVWHLAISSLIMWLAFLLIANLEKRTEFFSKKSAAWDKFFDGWDKPIRIGLLVFFASMLGVAAWCTWLSSNYLSLDLVIKQWYAGFFLDVAIVHQVKEAWQVIWQAIQSGGGYVNAMIVIVLISGLWLVCNQLSAPKK